MVNGPDPLATESKCMIVNIMTVIVIYLCTIYAGVHANGCEMACQPSGGQVKHTLNNVV